MLITQVRNATLIVEFGGVKFLIDPMLGDRGAYPGLPGTLNSHLPYPTASLKTPIEEILAVDAVSITHTHPDHFDQAAQDLIPKDLPLFVQHEADAALVKVAGFTDTRLLESIGSFNGVRLHKTPGRHGTDAAYAAIGSILGEVCGVEDAHRLKMRASPTVRIDGRDIALEFKVSRCKECGELCECVGGVDCRVWVWRGEEYLEAPKAMIVDALLRAYAAGPSTVDDAGYTLPDNLQHFFDSKAKSSPAATEGTNDEADCCDRSSCCDSESKSECCGETPAPWQSSPKPAPCGCR